MVDSSPDDNLGFNFIYFMKFLADNNVIATAIAAVLSDRISDITNTCVDHLLMPIINRDADGDGERDIKKLEAKVVKIYGMEFGVGKVFLALIKFMIITYVVFLISRLVNTLSKHK